MNGIVSWIIKASEGGSLVCGFNVFGYEDAQAVIRAAERAGRPAILMVNRDARAAMALEHWAALLKSLAEKASVPIGVHLDHCDDLAVIERAVSAGFHTVMYDGSKLPLQENIKNTKAVCEMAHEKGVFVEAELGCVPYAELGETEKKLTSPEEAGCFAKETGADFLAVSVGNVHRLIGAKARIDFKMLGQIERRVPLPLVIHGASGLPDSDLAALCKTRVGKVNVGTALRRAFGETLRQEVLGNPDKYDRLALFEKPVGRVEETAFALLTMLSSDRFRK